MATLASLVVNIQGNTAGLNQSIDRAQTRMGKFQQGAGKALGAVRKAALGLGAVGGAAIVGFGVNAVKSFIETGEQLDKMAKRTGISVESLSELKFAAEQSGASLETIEKAAKRMGATIFDANQDMKSANDALEALGLHVSDFEGLNPEQQFMELAGALGQVQDASEKAALAQKIFGRAGTELLPLFAEGFQGMDALRSKARELGNTFTTEGAASAAKFNDTINELKHGLLGAFREVATNVIPVMTNVAAWFVEQKPAIQAFIKDVQEKARPFFKSFMTGFGIIYDVASRLVMFIVNNKPLLIAAIAGIGAAIVVAMGPVSLASLAIVGIVTAIGWFADNWDEIWSRVKDTMKGAVNAIIGFFNSLLGAWNRLEFTLPSVSVPFVGDFGGFTVGTPDIPLIPMLARGARNFRGGMAMVGERGPELVNLPRGSDVIPNDRMMRPVQIIVQGPIYGFDEFEEKVNQARLAWELRTA